MNVVSCEVDVLDNATGTQSLPAETGTLDVDIRSVLVRLHTDAGVTGLGESFVHSSAPEDSFALARRVEALGRRVVGEDPRNVRGLWDDLYDRAKRSGAYDAVSALDEALWDLTAKDAGVPLSRLLGGSDAVNTYATFPQAKEPDELIEVGNRLADRGFEAMKIVAGFGVERDRERIRRVASGLPEGFDLAIDANTSYGFSDALAVAETAAEHDLLWFEEPIAHTDVQGVADLRRRSSVPIAGYQTHAPHYPAVDHLRADAYDVYQPSVYHVGGVTAATNVSALVEAFNREMVPHAVGPAVNYAASLHVAAASPACSLIEFAVFDDAIDDLGQFVASPYVDQSALDVADDGTITPPEAPGIGVELDEEGLDACRVDGD